MAHDAAHCQQNCYVMTGAAVAGGKRLKNYFVLNTLRLFQEDEKRMQIKHIKSRTFEQR